MKSRTIGLYKNGLYIKTLLQLLIALSSSNASTTLKVKLSELMYIP